VKTKLIAAIALLAICLLIPIGCIASGPAYHIEESENATIEISKNNIALYEYFWVNVTGEPYTYVNVAMCHYIGNRTIDGSMSIGTIYQFFLNESGSSCKKMLLTTNISGPGDYYLDAGTGQRLDFTVCVNETIRADYYEREAIDSNKRMSELFYAYYTERDYLQEKIFWRETVLLCLVGSLIAYAATIIILRKKEDAKDEN
jgi:hypothetical protein